MRTVVGTIKGKFTKGKLEAVLGEPSWAWSKIGCSSKDDLECGLTPGKLLTAGWGDWGACCRIWIHSDGICCTPGMTGIPEDIAYAEAILFKLKEVYDVG